MSSKKNKIEIEEKDNKIVYILIIVIAILLSIVSYYLFFNKCKNDCSKCEITPLDNEPKYQLINYSALTFKMPLNWSFVNDNTDYAITDSDNKIFISMETILASYNLFITNDYQNNFLEEIQTSNNIKIDKSKQEDNYYIYEGTYNSYNYLVIAVASGNRVVLVKTQFVDQATYNKQKKNVVEFVLSSIKKSDE